MNVVKFHLAQVAYQVKQLKNWGTGLYENDNLEKQEFLYHLQILMNIISLADPKYRDGMQRRKELQEEIRRAEKEEKERQKKLKKEQNNAINRADSKTEDDSKDAC